MIDLSRFFQNPFTDRCISLSHLHTFTTHHLGLLAAKDTVGAFTERLAATQAALTALDVAFRDNHAKLGQRKDQKKTKQAFRKALPAVIARVNVAVKAEYGERASQVTGCFPFGRKIFARCPDAVLNDHLEVLIDGLQTHAPDLDPEVPALVVKLQSDWLGLHQSSGLTGAQKKTAEATRREARRDLERELYLNLLALAQNFPLQPEKLAEYMQPSLLFPHRHHSSAPSTPVTG